jgi:Kef-type K+ transport system membrane component KefB
VNDPKAAKSQSRRSEHDDAIARVLRQRELHRQRSIPVRIAVALVGGLVGMIGAILVVPALEIGLPLLLLGLRLLAYEFYWAARAYALVFRFAGRVGEWYRQLPQWLRRSLITAIVLCIVALAVWLWAA